MEIKEDKQFNQDIGKYKLLSSTAGVGSIVATKWGGFLMPLSSSKWKCVSVVTEYLKEREDEPFNAAKILEEKGVELIDDNRFVNFLRSTETEGMTNLRCLVAIPHVSLDAYNRCDVKSNPINKRYSDKHPEIEGLPESMFTIPAVVFPRWFISRSSSKLLKTVEEWEKIWREKACNGGKLKYFVPPRDPYGKTNKRIYRDDDTKYVYNLLEQVSMVFICPNGHISDIPWDRYFSAKLEQGNKIKEEGFDLFNYDCQPCPETNGKHELQWLENRSHAESFGMLKCERCNQSVSLEGIMNLQPKCPGDRPWENKRDQAVCMQKTERTNMRWALVTSNSVYYAENFSSLYIPDNYLQGTNSLNDRMRKVLNRMENRWYPNFLRNHPEVTTRDEYARQCFKYVDDCDCDSFIGYIISRANDGEIILSVDEAQKISNVFLGEGQQEQQGDDIREQYRFTEFEVFQTNSKSLDGNEKLIFNDIKMPDSLCPYFHKIQQVSTLGISSTQINFSRVSMPQPELNDDGTINYPKRMKIFCGKSDEVVAMPATQSFGEGLFFCFNDETLKEWSDSHKDLFEQRYANMKKHDDTFQAIYQEMERGGIAKFLVLHTFSHVLMKELEFSCGYPTASLSERLYFSKRMCGVLIYTADGAEGSMGGLVWQGQPNLIESIIKKAMQRAVNCASDPICWENEDQLNFAACFSCAMVSETSCEKRNVGLDRRILVDETFGYFRDLIYDGHS